MAFDAWRCRCIGCVVCISVLVLHTRHSVALVICSGWEIGPLRPSCAIGHIGPLRPSCAIGHASPSQVINNSLYPHARMHCMSRQHILVRMHCMSEPHVRMHCMSYAILVSFLVLCLWLLLWFVLLLAVVVIWCLLLFVVIVVLVDVVLVALVCH